MSNLNHHPLFKLIFLALLSSLLLSQKSLAQHPPQDQPTAQELLLAELLAKLPEGERAPMIARALAAARAVDGVPAIDQSRLGDDSQVAAMTPKKSLEISQRLLQAELEQLRFQTQRLRAQLQRLQSQSMLGLSPTPLLPTPAVQGQAFLLPNFQRPGLQTLPGPYVNQPSPPLPARDHAQSNNPAAVAELAQLQRDLQRLNQRLKQWQDPSLAPSAELSRQTDESAPNPQATRPSPLLPR
jgi:hypothetical protein